jgi:hypothetical protein
VFGQKEGQGLERFAETHVVGQDAVEAEVAQEGEPVVAELLIGAQARVQPGRQLFVADPIVLAESRRELFPLFIALDVLRLAYQRVEDRCVITRHPADASGQEELRQLHRNLEVMGHPRIGQKRDGAVTRASGSASSF